MYSRYSITSLAPYHLPSFLDLERLVGATLRFPWRGFLLRVAPAGAGYRQVRRRVGTSRPAYRPLSAVLPAVLHRYRRFSPVWVPPSWRSDHSPKEVKRAGF